MAAPQQGTLSIVRPGANGASETFIKITADGAVTAFNGHVDLGTGIRTALGQIVAEELDVSFARVVVVLGDTSRVPNQGATIASETIQITAVPLRKAAAQARHFLVARAAERLELRLEDLAIEDGLIRGKDNRSVSYGELIAGETIRLELADDVPLKAVNAYTIVGQSVPRIDLPAKATGEPVYVHDVRVPGMLHGRVVRPPYAGVDGLARSAVSRSSRSGSVGVGFQLTLSCAAALTAFSSRSAMTPTKSPILTTATSPGICRTEASSTAIRLVPTKAPASTPAYGGRTTRPCSMPGTRTSCT